MSAVGELLTVPDLERGIGIFSRVSTSHGARPWTLEDVQQPAPLHLYRACASEHWVLDRSAGPTSGPTSGRSVGKLSRRDVLGPGMGDDEPSLQAG